MSNYISGNQFDPREKTEQDLINEPETQDTSVEAEEESNLDDQESEEEDNASYDEED